MFGKGDYRSKTMNTRPKIILGVLCLIILVLMLGILDWQSGFELNFFVFYFIPVSIAGWLYGNKISIYISILCAFVWAYADQLSGHHYIMPYFFVWNTLIRLTSFISIGFFSSKVAKILASEKEKTEKLEKSLSKIKILESFLSICSVCKRIRNENGQWQQLDSYISTHSDTKFSHGYCPECAKKALEDFRSTNE